MGGLVSIDVVAHQPNLPVLVVGRVNSFQVFAGPDLEMIAIVVGVYVARTMCVHIAIIYGDLNSTTCGYDSILESNAPGTGHDYV